MFRRRRTRREIEFSFDSFLDVVANVVGIIIRLILVAWISARAYHAVVPSNPGAPPDLGEPPPLSEPTDPRLAAFAELAHRIADEDEQRIKKEAEREKLITEEKSLDSGVREIAERRNKLEKQRAALTTEEQRRAALLSAQKLSTSELEARSKKLLADMKRLEKEPIKRKELRYRTPVSAEVQTDEVMFELKSGRVTLVDSATLVAKARAAGQERAKELSASWELTGTTGTVGAFRLRYTVERERSNLDGPSAGGPVGESFSYGITGWEMVPVDPKRGENRDIAMKPDSVFRRVVDSLDPKQTVVTLWVYPDSFPLYRTLRDYLHSKEFIVAGRPLPEASPIASSRKGTASRGQ